MNPVLRAALRIVGSCCNHGYFEEIEGDLIEHFARQRAQYGHRRAQLSVLSQAVQAVCALPGTKLRRRLRQVAIVLCGLGLAFLAFAIALSGTQVAVKERWLIVLGVALEALLWLLLFGGGGRDPQTS